MVFCGADFEVSKTPAAAASVGRAAKKAVNDAARKSKNIRELAKHAQNLMEVSQGLGWHVAVGTDFAVDLRYRKGACVLLSSRGSKMKVLLYRTVPALTPIPTEDHEALLSAEAAGTKGKLKQRITINECDMEAEVKDEVVSKTKRLLEHFNESPDVDSKVALALKHALTYSYGHTWHTIVSTTRELCCIPHFVPKSLADFSIDKYRVVVYRHGGSDVDNKMDFTRLANRLSLLMALVCLVIYGYFVLTATEKDVQCLSGKQSDAVTRLPMGCRLKDVVQANTYAAWKGMAMFGTMLFTVIASGLRMYRGSLHTKVKQL